MVVWMIAVPIVILLLALAGANWKTFHLAYAKHLMGSSDRDERTMGIDMVLRTHLRVDMSLEEVRRLLAPASVTETDLRKVMPLEEVRRLFAPAMLTESSRQPGPMASRVFDVSVGTFPEGYVFGLLFDKDDRLVFLKSGKGLRKTFH